ncbi:P-loop containing nucleoside triphosphate hydrolase protein [Pisolithus marmoratus]|nr:P-loop containing nucleoside triphosphate hydrolase protein [Pisolithus marmoratus]
MHTSSVLLSPARRKGRKTNSKIPSSPKSRQLAKSLKPTGKAKRLGTLEVAPKLARDRAPHEGRVPYEPASSKRRRTPGLATSTRSAEQKHFAALAHSERIDRRVAAARRRRGSTIDPLEQEFDTPSSASFGGLSKSFKSPPLLPGLLQCLHETIGENAKPTPIQALSLKHLFKQHTSDSRWTECLLASETGSGKSIAYLLPLLHDLKRTELEGLASSRKSSRPLNPRALVLAPTHELSRQLAGFAKKLSHIVKLRVMCASRANVPSTAKEKGTASKMKRLMEGVDHDNDAELFIPGSGRASRPVDLLVGTPMKLLEFERGRGWNWEQRARERALRINAKDGVAEQDLLQDTSAVNLGRKFWVDEPEMGLENVEWVVVDEADVLFDPDFQEATRMLLADIAAARGCPVPVTPVPMLVPQDAQQKSDTIARPISYPFNFLLTSATIPNSLSNYLSTYHPTLTRLASPHLHHLPRTLRTEHASWTGGNKDVDIERRIRRVWADDALVHAKTTFGSPRPVKLSKVIVFCNKRRKVEELGAFLDSRGIKCVALTGNADGRQRGSNHHLDGFLKQSSSTPSAAVAVPPRSSDPAVTPHVLVTTSLLSRGLDFDPDIKHVFIVDEPRNMIDFLHRAGRTGRAGEMGKVVVFGRTKGRGSGRTSEVRKKIGAFAA